VIEKGTDISDRSSNTWLPCPTTSLFTPARCAQAGVEASRHQPKEVLMPRRKVEPTEVTIEYLLPVYIVVRRDQELYGDSDLHIAKVVVDDEAEL